MRFNLSEITALIKDRRTIYPEQFSNREIQREQIETILNAAIWAPTHGNTQPWRFKVFMKESRQLLADSLGKTYLEFIPTEKQNDLKLAKLITRPLKASIVIAVCMEKDPVNKIKELDEKLAVACAIQNMLLTATAFGIGSFWATPGVLEADSFKRFLKIQQQDACLGLIYLGYPAIEWPQAHRKPIEYITEWNL